MRYESMRDVELRLKNSVVMCGGRPVIVTNVASIKDVIIQDILNESEASVKIADLDLAPSSAPLGYIMKGDKLLMGMRKPVRKYKQGLTTENMLTWDVAEPPTDEQLCRGLPTQIRAYDKAVGKCILGAYGDIGDVFKSVRDGDKRFAPFHRNWAVAMMDDDLSILHRGRLAGFITDTSVRLLPECFFLQESLSEALGD